MSNEAKEKLFRAMERIKDLKDKKALLGELTPSEDLELRNLEVKKWNHYSDWKDQE